MNFPKEKLKRILFIDIETATAYSTFDQMPKSLQSLWRIKSEHYHAFRQTEMTDQSVKDHFQSKAAIFAEFAKVVCISVGFLDGDEGGSFRVKSFYNSNEFELLTRFKELLDNYYYDVYNHFLCGHNIREFDIPFLCRRLIINGIGLPNLMNVTGQKPWQVHQLLDTMDLWKFGDYKHFTSLDSLCISLNIPSPKKGISGKDVSEYYWDNRINEIVEYCEDDVIATALVYLKCLNLSLFTFDKVIKPTRSSEEE